MATAINDGKVAVNSDIEIDIEEKLRKKYVTYSFDICGALKQFTSNPCKHWSYGLYLIFGIASIVSIFFYLTGGFGGFLLASCTCIAMSLYAIFSFNDLFFLEQQIKIYGELNGKFQKENTEMVESNKNLDKNIETLKKTKNKLSKNIKKLRKQNKIIQQFTIDAQKHNKSLGEQHDRVIQSIEKYVQQWKNDEAKLFRNVLRAARNATFRWQKDETLDEAAYNKFFQSLASIYQKRLKNIIMDLVML
eukprot:UN10790